MVFINYYNHLHIKNDNKKGNEMSVKKDMICELFKIIAKFTQRARAIK